MAYEKSLRLKEGGLPIGPKSQRPALMFELSLNVLAFLSGLASSTWHRSDVESRRSNPSKHQHRQDGHILSEGQTI